MAMAVNHGLVGPKERLKGVSDGQQVNIPVLLTLLVWSLGIVNASPLMVWGANNKRVALGKSGVMFPFFKWMDASCDAKVTFGNPIRCSNSPGKTSIVLNFGLRHECW